MVSTSSKVKFGLVNHQSYPEVQGGIPPLSPKVQQGVWSGTGCSHSIPPGCLTGVAHSSCFTPPHSPHPPVTVLFLLSFPPPPSLPHSRPFSNWQRVHVTPLLGNWSPSAVHIPVWKDISVFSEAPGTANFSQGFICQSRRLA